MKLSTKNYMSNLSVDANNYSYLEGDLLKKYQSYLLCMAKDIIEICEKENITYILGGGSALGAVRHGGFIPWDDDMDINILGDDYDRFKECFIKEHGDKYLIQDKDTSGYCMPSARVCLKGSVYRDYHTEKGSKFFVDIFRIENISDNRIIRKLHGFFCMGIGLLFSCRCFFELKTGYLKIVKENPQIASSVYFKIVLGAMLSFLSVDKWRKILYKCYGACKNSHSNYVGIPSGKLHYSKSIYFRKEIVNTVKMPFEGYQWNVAANYDVYLKRLYGTNYMTPPKEKEREHHFFFELKFPDEAEKES